MKLTNTIRAFVVILIGFAIGLIAYTTWKRNTQQPVLVQTKALQVKKHLLKYKQPARVEIESFTPKFDKDVTEIKKIKVPLNPKANFYILIQFFGDDADSTAPLVAQFRFIDLASGNMIKEESINLN